MYEHNYIAFLLKPFVSPSAFFLLPINLSLFKINRPADLSLTPINNCSYSQTQLQMHCAPGATIPQRPSTVPPAPIQTLCSPGHCGAVIL